MDHIGSAFYLLNGSIHCPELLHKINFFVPNRRTGQFIIIYVPSLNAANALRLIDLCEFIQN